MSYLNALFLIFSDRFKLTSFSRNSKYHAYFLRKRAIRSSFSTADEAEEHLNVLSSARFSFSRWSPGEQDIFSMSIRIFSKPTWFGGSTIRWVLWPSICNALNANASTNRCISRTCCYWDFAVYTEPLLPPNTEAVDIRLPSMPPISCSCAKARFINIL